ncbi:MAG: hypothetical protein WD572_10755 [Gammaproteobacteria bacterium]
MGTIYVLIALSTAYWLSRIPERQKLKTWTQILTVLVFVLIPTWDVLLGRLYFNYLCETEGDIKIHNQAELPTEHWEDGVPRDRLERLPGRGFEILIGEKFIIESHTIKNYGEPFRIDKEHKVLNNRVTDEVLSEFIYFIYWGGWLINASGLHRSGVSCPSYRLISKLYSETFIKEN